MEIRQLRYLVALARELSFTTAAARSNVAQPALSRQIRKLEEELGTALVDRTSRRVQMTPVGQRLADRARVILDELEAARSEVVQETQLVSGILAVGATQTPGPVDVARLLYDYHAQHPRIDLAVREELSVSIADRLRADEIDLGIIAEISESARKGLELELIASEPLVVSLPAEHRLASRQEIDFGDLSDEPFVLFPEGATIRETFDALAASHGVNPHAAFLTTDTDRMCELVALGLGVSLLPRSDAYRHGRNIAIAAIRGQDLVYNVYLARRRGRSLSPAANAMRTLVESAFVRD
jgi:DNA-binding transcriptional LysR family regulator